jgi:hypothetical protein
VGFQLFMSVAEKLKVVDIVSVVRHNKSLELGNYRKAAEEGNFFLRGFNYLFIAQKPDNRPVPKPEPKPDLRKRDRHGRLVKK